MELLITLTHILLFFSAIIGLGLNGVIIYELKSFKGEEEHIIGTAILMRLIVGVISSFACIGIVGIVDRSDPILLLVVALQAIQLPFLAFDTFNYWYQAKLQSKYSVIIQTTAYIITSGYKVYLLVTSKSVVWFAVAITLDVVLLAVFYLYAYIGISKQRMHISKNIGIRMLKRSYPFLLAGVMVFVYGQMDKIMLKQMLNSTTEVGLYSAALVICGIIAFIPTAIIDSGRPIVMEAKKNDEQVYQTRIRQLFAGVIWICVLYSIIVTLFSRFILNVLYGNDYLSANYCLKIAVWYTAFSYIGSAKSIWLICENKERYVMLLSVMGAATNLVLNFCLIPVLGINGAAIATLFTQIMTNVIYPLFFKEIRRYVFCIFDAIFLRNINFSFGNLLGLLKNIRNNEEKLG